MINKIIPQIDKLKHSHLGTLAFYVSNIVLIIIITDTIANWVSTLLPIVLSDKDIALIIAYFIVVITAAGKELYKDWFKKQGTPEWKDFWFSIMFSTLYLITYILSQYV